MHIEEIRAEILSYSRGFYYARDAGRTICNQCNNREACDSIQLGNLLLVGHKVGLFTDEFYRQSISSIYDKIRPLDVENQCPYFPGHLSCSWTRTVRQISKQACMDAAYHTVAKEIRVGDSCVLELSCEAPFDDWKAELA